MNKKYNIIKIIYFTIIGIVVFGYKDLSTLLNSYEYITCGTAKDIPRPIPQLTSVAYTLLVTATPLVLIIFSIIMLVKAVTTGSADEIEKAKKNLFRKFIIAAIIFFVSAIVQFVLLKVTTNKEDSKSVTSCMKCFMYYSEDYCPSYKIDDDGKRIRTKQTSNYTNNDIVHKSNSNSNSSSNGSSSSSKNVILVGDSRTVGICGFNDKNMHSGDKCRDYIAVAQIGVGASWFKNSAVPAVNKILNNNSGKKYEIIILLGANDVGSKSGDETASLNIYKEQLHNLANSNWKKHTIKFAKVSLVDQNKATSNGYSISQSQINSFNSSMKSFINNEKLNNLKYCAINDIETKYITDGIHFNTDGYARYYEEVKNRCV